MGKISSGYETSSTRAYIDGVSELEELIAILIKPFDKDWNSNGKSVILSSIWDRHLLRPAETWGGGNQRSRQAAWLIDAVSIPPRVDCRHRGVPKYANIFNCLNRRSIALDV